MPPRPPINPEGCYHVGSRGSYGRTLFANDLQYERFLMMYTRVSLKYHWDTLSWALVENHHHFVVRLTDGGLSEGMRELHGGYSRWIHLLYGQTRQGHLFRHGFFARELKTDGQVFVACSYVDLNLATPRPGAANDRSRWCGYRATIGLEHPRSFHRPSILLELFDPRPAVAQLAYREFVQNGLALRSQDPSPNDGVPPRG
ncbi:MAG: REP-associated tyrosine transposase [Gaiellaceae bacterium]|jgi:REP element-mobilizing transposase RayT|nr:REP-associated tyrosine transposase [Gaiellaceae bacterium]